MRRRIDKSLIKGSLGIALSAFLTSFAVKNFVVPANLVSAGITGLTLIIQKELANFGLHHISFGILYFSINVAILLFVYKHLGKKFVLFSFLHVIFTSIFVEIMPSIEITQDIILLTIFGGILNGLAISFALKMGGSSGGTDFVAIYFSTVKNKPMWGKVMIFNAMILLYNGWRYNMTLSFYSIIYQIISTEMISSIHDRYKLSSLRIITEHPQVVSEAILQVVRHGITQLDGQGIYKKAPRSMLYLVVNSFEIKDVISAVKLNDPFAFIEVSAVNRVEGNFRQKPLE